MCANRLASLLSVCLCALLLKLRQPQGLVPNQHNVAERTLISQVRSVSTLLSRTFSLEPILLESLTVVFWLKHSFSTSCLLMVDFFPFSVVSCQYFILRDFKERRRDYIEAGFGHCWIPQPLTPPNYTINL